MSAREALAAGLRAGAETLREDVVRFCRELVMTRSPSGDEGAAAHRVAQEMRDLGYDDVTVDSWGNVVGVLRGADSEQGAVLMDAHLDHVDEGDPAAWTHSPFGGDVRDGRLFGRGSTDTKSALAAQVHGAALLHRAAAAAGVALPRDIVVAAVVQEEVGGLGTAGLLESGRPLHAAIVGEPSLNGLAYGHRGRVEIEVAFRGKAAHASRPEWGVNPHPSLARLILALDSIAHDEDPRFGRSSAVPTLVHARPASPNVIPAEVVLTIDWRNVASERAEDVRARVREAAEAALGKDVTVEVRTPSRRLTSWTGLEREIERVSRPFSVAEDAAPFASARAALASGLGRHVEAMAWDFASDGGWLHAAGVSCVGFGPGEMKVMHAADESVDLDLVVEAVAGNALLALSLGDGP